MNLEICAGRQQLSDHLGGLAIASRVMDRGGAFLVSGVYVGAGVEQGSEDGVIVVPGSPVDRRPIAVTARLKVGAGRQQHLHQGRIVILVGGRVMKGSGAAIVSCFQVGAGRHQRFDHGGVHRRQQGGVQGR